MIVINRDKELITVESWDDVCLRPGFNNNLDPGAHELEAIIGRYAFRDYVPCGLSNCHTPHGKGYIAATKDGQETNIGKDCGKRYFGVDFEVLSAQFDRDITAKENREKLWSFFFRTEEVHDKVNLIRSGDRGADWVYKRCLPLLQGSKEVPAPVVRKIGQMIKTGQTIITVDREATDEEIAQMEAQAQRRMQRPQYISTPIAEISGLEALHQENNLRDILIISIEEPLKEFEGLNIDTLDNKALSKWSRWVGSVDEKLDRATEIVGKGRVLLRKSNLETLIEATHLDGETAENFQTFLKQLPP